MRLIELNTTNKPKTIRRIVAECFFRFDAEETNDLIAVNGSIYTIQQKKP